MAKRIGRNKKGSIPDLFLIGGILLFFAIVLLIGFKISSDFNTQIQGMSEIPTEAKTASTSLVSNYPGVLDNVFLVLTIGLCIGAIVLAALVRVHPIFIVFFFIAWVIVIFFSGVLSNIYEGMATNSQLVAQANQLTFTSNILHYLPFIIGIFGIILMMVMYKTWKNEQF